MAKVAMSQTAFSNKFKKRAKGGWSKAAEAAPKVKGQMIPDGLTNAVAQLIGRKCDCDKNGNPYIMFMCVLMEPAEYQGIKFNKSHFIRESKDPKTGKIYKTVDDRLEELSSDIQLLGGQTEGTDEDGLLAEITRLSDEVKPFFILNTWKPKDGQTQVFIQGLAGDDYNPGDAAEAVEEASTEEGDGTTDEATTEDGTDESADATTDAEVTDDGTPWVPAVKEQYLYRTGPKSRSKAEITAVNEEKQTVTVKLQDASKRVIKDVSWDKLEFED